MLIWFEVFVSKYPFRAHEIFPKSIWFGFWTYRNVWLYAIWTSILRKWQTVKIDFWKPDQNRNLLVTFRIKKVPQSVVFSRSKSKKGGWRVPKNGLSKKGVPIVNGIQKCFFFRREGGAKWQIRPMFFLRILISKSPGLSFFDAKTIFFHFWKFSKKFQKTSRGDFLARSRTLRYHLSDEKPFYSGVKKFPNRSPYIYDKLTLRARRLINNFLPARGCEYEYECEYE